MNLIQRTLAHPVPISCFLLQLSFFLFAQSSDKHCSGHSIYQQGLSQQRLLQLDSARISFSTARACFLAAGKTDSVAICVVQIGRTLTLKRQLSAAIDTLQSALLTLRSLKGDNRLEIALAENYLGNGYRLQKDYQKAEDYYRSALEKRITILGDNHPEVAVSYSNIGLNHFARNQLDAALEYYEKSQKIYEISPPGRAEEIGKLNRYIGRCYLQNGNLTEAQIVLEKALTYFSADDESNLDDRARTFLNLGSCALLRNDYSTAVDAYLEAEVLVRKKYGDGHRRLGTIYHNLAICYADMQRYSDSEAYTQKTYEIYLNAYGADHPRTGYLLNSMGHAQIKQQNFANGIDNISKALQTIDETDSYRIHIYQTLAEAYHDAGELSEALKTIDKAIAAERSNNGFRGGNISQSWRIRGDILAEQHQPDSALASYQNALIAATADFQNSDYRLNPLLEAAINEPELLEALIAKCQALYQQSKVQDNTDIINLAYQTATLAAQLVDQIRSGYRTESTRLIFGESVATFFSTAIEISLEKRATTGEDRYLEKAFAFAEKLRGATLAQALSEAEALQFGSLPDSLREAERQLKIRLTQKEAEFERLWEAAKFEENPQARAVQQEFLALKNDYRSMISRIEKQFPSYFALKYQTGTVSIAEVQSNLDSGSALISYSLGRKDLFAFVVTEKETQVFRSRIDASLLDLVNSFGRSLRIPSERRFYPDRAFQLYQKLIQPLEEVIGNKKRLVIIPGTELSQIPFEAMLTRKPESFAGAYHQLPYLLEKYEVAYHYSATLYCQDYLAARRDPQLLFGGFAPVFAETTGSEIAISELSLSGAISEWWQEVTTRSAGDRQFPPLPYSEQELRQILQHFQQRDLRSKIYLGQEASRHNFLNNCGRFRFLHLATHSFVNRENPRQSGIAFTNAADTEENILFAPEIYNLQLNAQLVVMSSCESGLGKVVPGEGLLAMTRGFLYAGVPNILVSLWKVDDLSTSVLMTEFYAGVSNKRSFSQSLRQAKLKMAGNQRTAFPGFWSSFVLIGR